MDIWIVKKKISFIFELFVFRAQTRVLTYFFHTCVSLGSLPFDITSTELNQMATLCVQFSFVLFLYWNFFQVTKLGGAISNTNPFEIFFSFWNSVGKEY